MARLARLVVPGIPHHVTQRGNGRARVFFRESDYARYRDWLAEGCRAHGVEAWAWVLMPNHVHLVLVPCDADGLRRTLAPLHRRYAAYIHARSDGCGHFWQGRFGSVARTRRISPPRSATCCSTRFGRGSFRRRRTGAGRASTPISPERRMG